MEIRCDFQTGDARGRDFGRHGLASVKASTEHGPTVPVTSHKCQMRPSSCVQVELVLLLVSVHAIQKSGRCALLRLEFVFHRWLEDVTPAP